MSSSPWLVVLYWGLLLHIDTLIFGECSKPLFHNPTSMIECQPRVLLLILYAHIPSLKLTYIAPEKQWLKKDLPFLAMAYLAGGALALRNVSRSGMCCPICSDDPNFSVLQDATSHFCKVSIEAIRKTLREAQPFRSPQRCFAVKFARLV